MNTPALIDTEWGEVEWDFIFGSINSDIADQMYFV